MPRVHNITEAEEAISIGTASQMRNYLGSQGLRTEDPSWRWLMSEPGSQRSAW